MDQAVYRLPEGAPSQPARLETMHPSAGRKGRINAFTVDVEDYFQVEAFRGAIARDSWDSMTVRVDRNTVFLLDLLAEAGVQATFFILGWVAERFPHVVRQIHQAGHEVASHGYGHELAHTQSRDVFRADIRRAKQLLEDICGVRVKGYRAPTFSIRRGNWWAYDVLGEEGYAYSSSLYPVSHDLYGTPDAPTKPFRPGNSPLLEIPLSTVKIGSRNVPCSGGGYFRLLPYGVSRWCFDQALRQRSSALVFYCHPWEFDPGQPRIRAGAKSRFRHYTNIGRMPSRVARLLDDYRWGRMDQAFSRDLEDTP
jgi:polysaccharide deacetylase family protein (PEP-CTERM system associated)